MSARRAGGAPKLDPALEIIKLLPPKFKNWDPWVTSIPALDAFEIFPPENAVNEELRVTRINELPTELVTVLEIFIAPRHWTLEFVCTAKAVMNTLGLPTVVTERVPVKIA